MLSFAPDRLIIVLFLLMYASCSLQKKSVLDIQVSNELDIERNNETVVIGWSVLKEKMPDITPERIRLIDRDVDREIIWQTVDKNNDKKIDEFIFQANFEALESKNFLLQRSRKRFPHFKTMVSVKQVPQGMDDFNWENDLIGYRFYGLTREKEQGTGSGIDIWSKRVPYRMIEKWYQPDINYHEDTGEGADFYKVGANRGCGGTGILLDNKIHFSKVFSAWKIITDGPIRVIFELEFSDRHLNNKQIKEIKRISLDAGHYFNKFEITYQMNEEPLSFLHAVGITMRPDSEIQVEKEAGWLGTWESLGEEKGYLGCGIIASTDQIHDIQTLDEHQYMFLKAETGKPIQYYSGAAWSEYGAIKSYNDWKAYIAQQVKCMNNPCTVHLKK